VPAGFEQARRNGGTFQGTFAYAADIGCDAGQFDDNRPSHPQQKRKPDRFGKQERKDPGDVDGADFYFDRLLYNDGRQWDYEDFDGTLGYDEPTGWNHYWHASRMIPLRYDDYWQYMHFSYGLGGRAANGRLSY
jgi:hypothetical protein